MPVFIHSSGGGVDISSTTAKKEDVLSGRVFYLADGTKAQGSIESISSKEHTPTVSDIIRPSGVYIAGDQVIKGDANLIASNIKSGVNIFGVLGNYSLASKTASGTFSGYTLKVNTGFRPLGVIVYTTNSSYNTGDIILAARLFTSSGGYVSSTGAYCYDNNGQRIRTGGSYIGATSNGFEWSASSIDTYDGYINGYMRSGRWYAVGI